MEDDRSRCLARLDVSLRLNADDLKKREYHREDYTGATKLVRDIFESITEWRIRGCSWPRLAKEMNAAGFSLENNAPITHVSLRHIYKYEKKRRARLVAAELDRTTNKKYDATIVDGRAAEATAPKTNVTLMQSKEVTQGVRAIDAVRGGDLGAPTATKNEAFDINKFDSPRTETPTEAIRRKFNEEMAEIERQKKLVVKKQHSRRWCIVDDYEYWGDLGQGRNLKGPPERWDGVCSVDSEGVLMQDLDENGNKPENT